MCYWILYPSFEQILKWLLLNICDKNILHHFWGLIFANLSLTDNNKFFKYNRITIGKNKFRKNLIEFSLVFNFCGITRFSIFSSCRSWCLLATIYKEKAKRNILKLKLKTYWNFSVDLTSEFLEVSNQQN